MAYYLIPWMLETSISLRQFYVVIMVMNLVAVLPISINGIGVADGTFVYMVGLYGVS